MFAMRTVRIAEASGKQIFMFGKILLDSEGLVRRMENYSRRNRHACDHCGGLDERPSYLAAQMAGIRHRKTFDDRAAAIILATESRLTIDWATCPLVEIELLTPEGAGLLRELNRLLADPMLDVRTRVIAEEAKRLVTPRPLPPFIL